MTLFYYSLSYFLSFFFLGIKSNIYSFIYTYILLETCVVRKATTEEQNGGRKMTTLNPTEYLSTDELPKCAIYEAYDELHGVDLFLADLSPDEVQIEPEETLTYEQLKKLVRKPTIRQIRNKSRFEPRYYEKNNLWSNNILLIFDPSERLTDGATTHDEDFEYAIDAFLSNYTEKTPATPITTIQTCIQFSDDDGLTATFDGQYLRLLWDECPTGTFFLSQHGRLKLLFLYDTESNMVGCLAHKVT